MPLFLIGFHIFLGIAAYIFMPIIKVYLLAISIFLIFKIFSDTDKNKAVLLAAMYITGGEVFFRMTQAYFFWETGKYLVIIFFLLGMFFNGFKSRAFPYAVYILFLVPAILVSFVLIDFEVNFRKAIMFNFSGPVCLAISAIYCHERRIKFQELLSLLDYVVYPLISMTIFVYLYNPDIQSLVTGTASSAETSGGYGPNQVSTMFGLGVFILFTRLFFPYKNKIVHFVMMFFLIAMAYRALITFSRGGVIVAGAICIVFSIVLYFSINLKARFKFTYKMIALLGGVFAIWLYAILQTGGMIENRYTNKDALGRDKDDITTGRGDLIEADFNAFQESPIFGIGVGRVKYYYQENIDTNLPSHNEVARMFSEHGIFGVFALMVLIISPFFSIISGRRNIFFLPFLLFWLLTIFHSSMRIAAPAFIYGLSLLNIDYSMPKNIINVQEPQMEP